MLKHYVTFYPNTDKLKTFKQTWKDRDDLYEEYYENGKLSLRKKWDGDIWVKRKYDKNGIVMYYEDSDGNWHRYEYDEKDNVIDNKSSKGFYLKRKNV